MPRPLQEIAADFDALTDSDFADGNVTGIERLRLLCDELRAIDDVKTAAPIMFRTMERLNNDDLGSPGSLVHTLETWKNQYQKFLVESVHRKPCPLSLWMVNRILNTDPADAEMWLNLLRKVATHPAASAGAKREAIFFQEYQNERATGCTAVPVANELYLCCIKVSPGAGQTLPANWQGAYVPSFVAAPDEVSAVKLAGRKLAEKGWLFDDLLEDKVDQCDTLNWDEYMSQSWPELQGHFPTQAEILLLVENGGVFLGPLCKCESEA